MLSTVDLCPSPCFIITFYKTLPGLQQTNTNLFVIYISFYTLQKIYKNSKETYKREKRERTHTKKKNNKTKQKL